MEEGETGAEIQDQGLAQATAASESRDATEKDGAGNQDSEEENHEEEEDQTGNSWGHAKLPGDVYGSSPFLKSGRNKQHVVWDDVKFLKKHTAQGTTVHEKYTHVCVARITAAKAGEEGEDEDGEGNWRWYCNKLLKLRKGKNCYNTTQATFLSMYLYKLYLAAEFAVSERTVACHQIACFPSLRICMP